MTESTPNVGKWRAIPREPRLLEAHATVLVCDDFGVDARLVLDGDFASDGERDAYVKQLLARLNEPSPKRREAIEADMRRGSRLTTHRLAEGNFGKPQTPPAQSPTPAVDDVKEPSPFYAAPQASAMPQDGADVVLPKLPFGFQSSDDDWLRHIPGSSNRAQCVADIEEYARAAVLADRQQRAAIAAQQSQGG